MFSFLKKFFYGQDLQILRDFYQHTDQNKALWVSVAINKNNMANSILTKELDIITKADLHSLKMAETNDGVLHQLWKNQGAEFHSIIKFESAEILPINFLFNQLIDKLLEEELTYFKEQLNTSTKTFLPSEIPVEDKALEWMRVSFQVLEKAIIESFTNPDFLFQTLLFLGVNPKTLNHEIRLIIFNLDMTFVLQANNLLRIKIYNDKNNQLGTNPKADLEGDFNFRKREMLDELIKLLSVISPGIKW